MQVIRAQVFDPIFHPGGAEYPPRIEIMVEGIDLEKPDHVRQYDEWTLASYGEFYLFFHERDLGERDVLDPATGEWEPVMHEGLFNVSGILTEPVFPVTVAVDTPGVPWRDLYAPVSLVREWLREYAPGDARGRWTLRPSDRWATRCQVVFELHFVPWKQDEFEAGARAAAARKPRGRRK